MKFKFVLILVAAIVVLVGALSLAGLFSSMTPVVWPITSGTLKATKVNVLGQNFVMVEGEAMNQLGQIQSLEIDFDDARKRIIVNRYLIRWNPFTKITVNNQWPVFYPLEFLKPGKYTVVYKTKDGEATAGSFDIP